MIKSKSLRPIILKPEYPEGKLKDQNICYFLNIIKIMKSTFKTVMSFSICPITFWTYEKGQPIISSSINYFTFIKKNPINCIDFVQYKNKFEI